jgi:hypothetical protein
MKTQQKHHILTGISVTLLVVMLATNMFAGLPPQAFAQAGEPESSLQISLQSENEPTSTADISNQPTPTPDPTEPAPEESPTLTPE